jgi:hypothetical protein
MAKITNSERQNILGMLKTDTNKIEQQLSNTSNKAWEDIQKLVNKQNPKYAKNMSKIEQLQEQKKEIDKKISEYDKELSFFLAGANDDEATKEEIEYFTKNKAFFDHVKANNYGYGNYTFVPSYFKNRYMFLCAKEMAKQGLETPNGSIKEIKDKIERDISLAATLEEARDSLAQLYFYDWKKIGVDYPPELPMFIKIGNTQLKLGDNSGDAGESEA